MNTLLRTTGLTLGLLFSLFYANQCLALGLTSTVDRTSIAVDESITLKVVLNSFQAQGEPDFTSLSQNFDIASNNRSSQQSYVNGTVTASTEWTMTLFPKSTGQLLIPPFTFQGSVSQPITINVTQAQSVNASGIKPDVFLETSVEKTEVFVQEQTIVTLKLFFNRSVSSLDSQPIKAANLRVEELPRADYQKTLGNVTYGVAEFRYALIADASGDIDVPPLTWTVESTDRASNRYGFNGGRSKLHRVKTEAIHLKVKPKPDSYPPLATWIPATQVTLTQSWSQPPEKFKLGEPITRTVTIQAEGVSAEQLPPIFSDNSSNDFKFYPDKPNQENHPNGTGLNGTRTESIAIVPSRSGDLTLPEVAVTWWDTKNQVVKVAKLPSVRIHIDEPSKLATPTQTASILPELTPSSEPVIVEKTSIIWTGIAITSLLCNALMLGLLWWYKRNATSLSKETTGSNIRTTPNLKQALQRVSAACDNRDPVQLRSAILSWAAIAWPNRKVHGLQDIADLCENQDLAQALNDLNTNLFSDVRGEIPYSSLKMLVQKMNPTEDEQTRESVLKPLYGR